LLYPFLYGIIATPYRQWIKQTIDAEFEVSILRLSTNSLLKFNEEKAIAFFKKNKGFPYGFHNFIYGWIDTISENYPPPLIKEDYLILIGLLSDISPFWAKSLFLEGLNFRLGTQGLDLKGILKECDAKNITIYNLIAQKELDPWIYHDGPSMVCDVFVMELYRAAGVFGDLQFQATEFTPKDSYQIDIFEKNWVRPKPCEVDKLPYCQVMGKYLLELPGFSKVPMYANMNEKCGNYSPFFERPDPMC